MKVQMSGTRFAILVESSRFGDRGNEVQPASKKKPGLSPLAPRRPIRNFQCPDTCLVPRQVFFCRPRNLRPTELGL